MASGPEYLRAELHARYLKSEMNYEIAEARSEGEPLADLARRLGVSASFASKMAKQKAWMV
jgi:Mn-dependent DtxR family transcriptional regulator